MKMTQKKSRMRQQTKLIGERRTSGGFICAKVGQGQGQGQAKVSYTRKNDDMHARGTAGLISDVLGGTSFDRHTVL